VYVLLYVISVYHIVYGFSSSPTVVSSSHTHMNVMTNAGVTGPAGSRAMARVGLGQGQ